MYSLLNISSLCKWNLEKWLSFLYPYCFHDNLQMKELYDWHDVAKRTEIVYDRALKCENQCLLERLYRYAIEVYISLYSQRYVCKID